MIRAPLSAEALREKLAPPRPLERIADALYARPLAGSRIAWIAWLPDGLDRALDALVARAKVDGARTLAVGGPPGNYLASGVDLDDTELCKCLESRGFVASNRHLDLVVSTAGHALDARVARTDDDDVIARIGASFTSTWAMEAERARSHGGLFVARRGEDLLGFACHSGNRAWASNFGPIGVAPEARGGGLGRALASTVLCDLAARGHADALVPWVDGETARFYASFCVVLSRAWRAEYRLALA
ncbi:MAG: GNAT family N-acetyltransferase [Polyangiales bacterium]